MKSLFVGLAGVVLAAGVAEAASFLGHWPLEDPVAAAAHRRANDACESAMGSKMTLECAESLAKLHPLVAPQPHLQKVLEVSLATPYPDILQSLKHGRKGPSHDRSHDSSVATKPAPAVVPHDRSRDASVTTTPAPAVVPLGDSHSHKAHAVEHPWDGLSPKAQIAFDNCMFHCASGNLKDVSHTCLMYLDTLHQELPPQLRVAIEKVAASADVKQAVLSHIRNAPATAESDHHKGLSPRAQTAFDYAVIECEHVITSELSAICTQRLSTLLVHLPAPIKLAILKQADLAAKESHPTGFVSTVTGRTVTHSSGGLAEILIRLGNADRDCANSSTTSSKKCAESVAALLSVLPQPLKNALNVIGQPETKEKVLRHLESNPSTVTTLNLHGDLSTYHSLFNQAVSDCFDLDNGKFTKCMNGVDNLLKLLPQYLRLAIVRNLPESL